MILYHNHLLGPSTTSNTRSCGSHEYPVKPEVFAQRYCDAVPLEPAAPEQYHVAVQSAEAEKKRLHQLLKTTNDEAARMVAKEAFEAAKTEVHKAEQELKHATELHPKLSKFATPTSSPPLTPDSFR